MLKNTVSSLSDVADKYIEELSQLFEDHKGWLQDSVALTKKDFQEFV